MQMPTGREMTSDFYAWSIYPPQIAAIVEAMRPEFTEVRDAANILLAAQKADWGPIQYEGELHDRASYRYFGSCCARPM